jgi:hypothetical protein
MSKPVFDIRCSPRIAGLDLAELYNTAIDQTRTPEERRLAKSHLLGYVSKGPDNAFASHLVRLLDWYAANPQERPTPLSYKDIPRFSPPSRKLSPKQEEPLGMWDF